MEIEEVCVKLIGNPWEDLRHTLVAGKYFLSRSEAELVLLELSLPQSPCIVEFFQNIRRYKMMIKSIDRHEVSGLINSYGRYLFYYFDKEGNHSYRGLRVDVKENTIIVLEHRTNVWRS